MVWGVPVGLLVAGLMIVLFILLTDGRYFGKRLMYWVYDRVGPAVFSARSEGEHWRSLVESMGLQGSESVLDVGTAAGDLPLSIASLSGFQGRIVGVDWSPRMIERALDEASHRGLGDRVRFEVVDVREGLPFGAGEFDAIVCLGLLETLPKPEKILEELRRVLKEGGVMALSLYQGWASKSVALGLGWYKSHLGPLGVGKIEVVPCRGHHDVVIARFNGQSKDGFVQR
jgi:ubiquinone/menaquinone biosynthesis C-methylase UbiE